MSTRTALAEPGQAGPGQFELDCLRATESAALSGIPWLGRLDKESADAAASDAIRRVLNATNIRGEVVIGEGLKDEAPGIFVGEKLGSWSASGPRFDFAADPIDGTSNLAKGRDNAICVIAASEVAPPDGHAMHGLAAFYSQKLGYGPEVANAMKAGVTHISLREPLSITLPLIADVLGKRMSELVVVLLDRPRNRELIEGVRECNAALRLITDGDITAALAPSLPDSGVDLYCGIGGSTEGVLAAAALKTLGGDMQLQMWPYHHETERDELLNTTSVDELDRVFMANDLVKGTSAIFCATGISTSWLLPGVKFLAKKVVTQSISMCARSATVRYVRAEHAISRA